MQKTNKVVATCAAKCFDSKVAGTYTVNSKIGLNCRNDSGTNKKSLVVLRNNTEVKCYGYYNIFNGIKWLYVTTNQDGIVYQGFVCISYLVKK